MYLMWHLVNLLLYILIILSIPTCYSVTKFFSRTDCVFSPDDKLIVTGISLNRGDTEGKLVFLDRESLKTVYEIVVSDSVSSTRWYLK